MTDLRTVTGAEHDVLRLLNPGSVAVPGASSRPGTLSWWPLHLFDFYKVAEMAAELDKPIALLKVGRSEQGIRRASAHTCALAGSDEMNCGATSRYARPRYPRTRCCT
jgi:acyl-CoA synthetase (NDP forming)